MNETPGMTRKTTPKPTYKKPKRRVGKQIAVQNHFLLNVGYDNFVSTSKVVAILAFDSAPTKRLVHEAGKVGNLLDATFGRLTRSVIVMDDGHVVLSALNPETIWHRTMLAI